MDMHCHKGVGMFKLVLTTYMQFCNLLECVFFILLVANIHTIFLTAVTHLMKTPRLPMIRNIYQLLELQYIKGFPKVTRMLSG